jgi:nitroreductase
MKPVNNETIVRQLNWRYATKRFDPNRKIQAPDWRTLAQSLVLAPSSFGIQAYKYFVIESPDVRAELAVAAPANRAQVLDASHLVVFAYNKNYGPADVQHFIDRVAEVRDIPVESLEGYKQAILGSLKRPADAVHTWLSRQPYIALGMFLSTAAMLGIDAGPMEGFDADAFDKILGLDKLGFHAVCMAAAGYRAADDSYAALAKVRFPAEELIVTV